MAFIDRRSGRRFAPYLDEQRISAPDRTVWRRPFCIDLRIQDGEPTQFALMDREFIQCDGPNDRVEFCYCSILRSTSSMETLCGFKRTVVPSLCPSARVGNYNREQIGGTTQSGILQSCE
jgi:hypothetical protein